MTDTTAMAVAEIVNSKAIFVIVKPNSSKNEIVGYNSEKKAFLINIENFE